MKSNSLGRFRLWNIAQRIKAYLPTFDSFLNKVVNFFNWNGLVTIVLVEYFSVVNAPFGTGFV